jgi:hypothetical protein
MKKLMINDNNINDSIIKKINPNKFTNQSLSKKMWQKLMKQLMIDDNNINDLVIKSI